MATLSEKLQADRLKQWLFEQNGILYSLTEGSDPPDFVLDSLTRRAWLEVTDIYLSEDQAEFLNSPSMKNFSWSGSVDATALRLLNQLNRKLSKTSYRQIFEERGKGILLLTCEDVAFNEIDLAHVHGGLQSFSPFNDQGFFDTAYFEYRLDAGPFIYELVYPCVRAADE